MPDTAIEEGGHRIAWRGGTLSQAETGLLFLVSHTLLFHGAKRASSRPPLRSSRSVASTLCAEHRPAHPRAPRLAEYGSFPSFPIRPQWARKPRAAPQQTPPAAPA